MRRKKKKLPWVAKFFLPNTFFGENTWQPIENSFLMKSIEFVRTIKSSHLINISQKHLLQKMNDIIDIIII